MDSNANQWSSNTDANSSSTSNLPDSDDNPTDSNANTNHSYNNNNNNNNKFSLYELECISLLESSTSPDIEAEFENERQIFERKLWTLFQNSATAIVQLNSRDNLNMSHVWNTFQQASNNVTCLYKESAEYHKRNYDLYHQIGYHKRSRELLNWIKKKRNLIRREELLAFLSGHHNNNNLYRFPRNHNFRYTTFNNNINNNNNNNNNLHGQPLFNYRNNSATRFLINEASKTSESTDDCVLQSINESCLETFKESLVSNIRNSTVLINSNQLKRNQSSWNHEVHNEFIEQQYLRHVESRKRTPSMDICMDSPNSNQKRTKFC